MPIRFTCPHCDTQTNVDDQYAGQFVPCPVCEQPVAIPGLRTMTDELRKSSKTSKRMTRAILLLVVIGFIMLTWFCVQAVQEEQRRLHCRHNLATIGLAMHNYHAVYGCLPPAVTTDEKGNPPYSWRVALLPFIGRSDLYDQWNFEEAWDSPDNSALGLAIISAYRCPSAPSAEPLETSYVMVTGQMELGGRMRSTIAGQPNEASTFADITDGMSNTVMVIEVINSAIPWSEPHDPSIEELKLTVNGPFLPGIASCHRGGAFVLLADGSACFLSDDVAAEMLKKMLLKDDGTEVLAF